MLVFFLSFNVCFVCLFKYESFLLISLFTLHCCLFYAIWISVGLLDHLQDLTPKCVRKETKKIMMFELVACLNGPAEKET